MRRFLTFLIFGLSFLGAAQRASADTPLGPPSRFTQCSANGIFCVEMVPDSDGTVFRKDSTGRRTNLWVIPGWHRAVYVSDNGHHLVKCYGGLNLVPIRFDPTMPLVEIWRDGVRKHQLSLRTVVGDPSKMVRTVSHYAWGSCQGFESETRFVLGTQAYDPKPPNDLLERKVVVDVETGKLVRTSEITRQ
jgi:hypothetical protein